MLVSLATMIVFGNQKSGSDTVTSTSYSTFSSS